MKKPIVYLDNSATTQVDTAVVEVMTEMMLHNYGNPSSLHFMGTAALNAVFQSRCQVAQVIGCETQDIIFTSGGTESNNLAIKGCCHKNKSKGKTIITTAIEHSSVLKSFESLQKEGFIIKIIYPNKETHLIEAQDLIDAVDEDTIFLSMMHVNNETGEILPVEKVIEGVKKKNPQVLIHCDCVQSFAKRKVNIYHFDADFISMSGHKIYASKGVGALYIKDKSSILPLVQGGSQEKGLRVGTENTASIVGMGKACSLAIAHMSDTNQKIQKLHDLFIKELYTIPDIHINSPKNALPFIINFSLLGHKAYDILSFMEQKDIYISNGSACEKGAKSHVLIAAGYSDEVIEGGLRISLGKYNTENDIHIFISALKDYISTVSPTSYLFK